MKRPPPDAEPDPGPSGLVRIAAEWRARADAGLTPVDEQALARWRHADPRHEAAYREIEQTWSLLDRAAEVPVASLTRPGPDGVVRRWRGPRAWRLAAASTLLAAAALAALFWVPRAAPPVEAADFNRTAIVGPGLAQRLNLPDGSVVRLNSDSEIAVGFSSTERRVRLVRGEAHFDVAKHPQRPFIVSAVGVDVRAVGTAFNVAVRADSIEVLVTEGKVRVGEEAGDLARPGGTAPPAAARVLSPLVTAGERAVVPRVAAPQATRTEPVIDRVAPDLVRHRLAWRERRLEFDAVPLAVIAGEFNRFNAHQLIVADARLGAEKFSGSFRADDPETFVHLIQTRGGIVAEDSPQATTLRRASAGAGR